MSTVTAYDVKARKNVAITPSSIKVYKYGETRRYRVSGLSEDGNKLSRFLGEEEAKKLAKKHGGIHQA